MLLMSSTSSAAASCVVRLSDPELRDGHWVSRLDVSGIGLTLAGVLARETGEDIVLTVRNPNWTATSDVSPSRYATERASLLAWGDSTFQVEAWGFSGVLSAPPQLSPWCLRPSDNDFLIATLWQGLAELVHWSDSPSDPAARPALRKIGVDYAADFIEVARSRDFPPRWTAMARQARGYLLSRSGRRADAKSEFSLAEQAWRLAGIDGAAAAARFNESQEELALGGAERAMETLRPLLRPQIRDTYFAVWVWASNDYCVALRNLDRRAEAADCFAQLIPILDAHHESKEAANTLCNLGAALGAMSDWRAAAPVLRECSARRESLGAAAGIAHAQLLLGWLALESGSLDEAVSHFERSAAEATAAGNAGAIWDAQRWLAQAWLDADELPRAKAALDRIIPDPKQDPSRNAQWYLANAQVSLYADDIPAAIESFSRAANQFEANGQSSWLTDTRCLWGLIDAQIPIESDCEPLVAAQALLCRADHEGARQRLHRIVSGEENELLREFLLQLASGARVAEFNPSAETSLRRAAALPVASPRQRSQRGQLLSRMGFELSRIAYVDKSQYAAKLALQALWMAGGSSPTIGRRLIDIDSSTSGSERAAGAPQLHGVTVEKGNVLVLSTSFAGEGYLVVAHPDEVDILKLDMNQVSASGAAWLVAIRDENGVVQRAHDVSEELYVRSWLRQGDTHLFLLVHGVLSTLPWSALPIGGEPIASIGYRPLVDQASTAFLAREPATTPILPTAKAIRFAPEILDESLPGLAVERKQIEVLARRSGWQVEDVSRVKGGVLHIAGHAVADRADPSGSRWIDRNENMDFAESKDGPSLVVLAGCETGVGPLSRWTSPISLASQAIEQGTNAAIAHLWPISDSTAAHLHAELYRSIFSGARLDEALRNAQLEQIGAVGRHTPIFWASPILLVRRDEALSVAAILGAHKSEAKGERNTAPMKLSYGR